MNADENVETLTSNGADHAELLQLRTAVADLLADRHVESDDLHRWLSARNEDVVKAEKMLRDSVAWRKQIGADQLVEFHNSPEVLRKYFPVGLIGHDKHNRPLWIIPFGRCDLKGLMQSAKKSDYVKYCVHLMELSLRDMKTHKRRHVVVFDLDHFGLRQATFKPGVDLMVHVSKVLGDNYPETLESVYIVNTPKVFEVAYAVLKKFINETTIRKIHVFGREHWQEALLEQVDASELPVNWGGTKIDGSGDPCCPTLICCGGDVPQSYYMAPANRLCDASNVQHAVVAKGSKLWISRDVQVANSILKWEFQTEGNDIGFAVYHRPLVTSDGASGVDIHAEVNGSIDPTQCTVTTEAGMLELMPNQRVNCHLVPEDGHLICTEPGKYVLCFDNSFSRLRSKKLSYIVEVLSAVEKDQ